MMLRLYPILTWRNLTMKYTRFEGLPVWKDAIELQEPRASLDNYARG
jgi:hypothetical protein